MSEETASRVSLRKVALRLGHIPTSRVRWQLEPDTLNALLRGNREWSSQVNQLVLVSSDSDFVPAAKLARREGIDFVLDPMWSTIRPDLHEHIDGLRSVSPNPDPCPCA